MDLDSILKVCKIVFMVLIPISLFLLSSKYTRHIEDKKNQSSAVYDWNAKWADIFFKSYKNYQDLILELLHTVELLQLKVKSNTQNSDEGTEIQKRMNLAMLNIHKGCGKNSLSHSTIMLKKTCHIKV